jgi:probable addiction module antidote protein
MTQIAKAAGLGRESLYKSLSKEGNPEFATVLKVTHALGLKLKVAA